MSAIEEALRRLENVVEGDDGVLEVQGVDGALSVVEAREELARLVCERDEGRLALAAIGALVGALRCPSCSKLHLDAGRVGEEQSWATHPHLTHRCVNDAAGRGCGHEWRQPNSDIVDRVTALVRRVEFVLS